MSEPHAKMRLVASRAPDGEHVQIQLDMNDKPLGYILFDGATAELHAIAVAKVRSELPDPVAPTLDDGSRVEAIANPAWRLDQTEIGPILALRHPGLGWLGFVFPPHEAKHIGEVLLELSRTSDAGPGAA